MGRGDGIDNETVELLRALVGEVRGLRADLARQQSSGTGREVDERHAALLVAIVEAVGDHEFSSVELVRHAAAVGGNLRAALDALHASTPRRLGKCLKRIEGSDCGGFAIERIGEDGSGAIWRVCRV
jgi:hypothetical protein